MILQYSTLYSGTGTIFAYSLYSLCTLWLIVATPLDAKVSDEVMGELFDQGIVLDLRQPTYCEGVLSTQEGGVIQAPELRIQARCIEYTKKQCEGEQTLSVVAEGDLMLELGEYIFVGRRLEYDFITRTGVVYDGRTALEPWYFGGKRIRICPDGSYCIYDGFITTSENYNPEWEINTQQATLNADHELCAKNVQFRLLRVPVFYIPSFRTNLDSIFDVPIRYTVKWGGRQGPRVGMIYEVFDSDFWKVFFRLDYRITRGIGGGLETHYRSLDRKERFNTISYMAQDSSLLDTKEKVRYRFQGTYDKIIDPYRMKVHLSYDKLSDQDMATDYDDKGLELETAKRTELHILKEADDWITNFFTRVRVNNFQTVKEELPTLETALRPYVLGPTCVVGDTLFRASYLDFLYGNNLLNVHDYNSTRFEFRQKFYRSFHIPQLTLTPQATFLSLFYGNSPEKKPRWLLMGLFENDLQGHFYRFYGSSKHVLEPYLRYQYFSAPSTSPDDHYIFDIDDGWYRLNMLRFGLNQSLYGKGWDGCVRRLLVSDLYSYAFFDTQKIGQTIPKIYARVMSLSLPTLRHIVNTAWDLEHNQIDHFNFRSEWTVDTNLALACEFRYRSPFCWRKVDPTNFILDFFRSEAELRHSSLSDQRKTVLLHLYYRFHPNWAIELQSRHGWDREIQPAYNEFEIDLHATLRSAWKIKLAYQHKENDDRVAIYVSLGLKRPDPAPPPCFTCLD